jgi:hypothetical protein
MGGNARDNKTWTELGREPWQREIYTLPYYLQMRGAVFGSTFWFRAEEDRKAFEAVFAFIAGPSSGPQEGPR